jgi:DeoR family ulaG and ulaABCDEF operon transcriptional repressor
MHERERWQVILGAVHERAVVTVRDLVQRTGVSPATLRRDLVKLVDAGQIRRVHGGVEGLSTVTPKHLNTRAFGVSQALHGSAKQAIGRAAAAMCRDDDSIIINAGSTTFQMVEFLREKRLQIVTNSFPIAEALVSRSNSRVILPGGEIYPEQGIVLSPFDGDATQHYTAAIMFMGCYSIGPLGVIEGDPLIARGESKLLHRAQRLVVLADASKFETRGSMAVCPLSRVDTLITDDQAPEKALEVIRKAGVNVIVVSAEESSISTAA